MLSLLTASCLSWSWSCIRRALSVCPILKPGGRGLKSPYSILRLTPGDLPGSSDILPWKGAELLVWRIKTTIISIAAILYHNYHPLSWLFVLINVVSTINVTRRNPFSQFVFVTNTNRGEYRVQVSIIEPLCWACG